MNLIILGANSVLANLVEKQLLSDKAFSDVLVTMLLRKREHIASLLSDQVIVIEGDIDNYDSLQDGLEDQDLVFDATELSDDSTITEKIIKAMKANGVNRVISINKSEKINQRSTDLYKSSGLDYTVLQVSGLIDTDEIDYKFISKGEQLSGISVSRKSLADIVLRIIDDPDYLSMSSVAVSK